MDTKSLISLWNHTQQHPGTSGGRACAGVLLGLYNGSRFPFDLTELRLLDPALRGAALQVIAADATFCKQEVHAWLNTLSGDGEFGDRFELLAWEYKCFSRGRCKAEYRKELEMLIRHKRVLSVPSEIVGRSATSVIVDELFGMPVVESTAVPAGEIWFQQAVPPTPAEVRKVFDNDSVKRWQLPSDRIEPDELDTLPNLFQQRNHTE